MVSGYLQCLSTWHPMPRSFRRAVRRYGPLVESTMYWRNINAYRRYFSDSQLLVIFFEDFRSNPGAVLERCYRFLGVHCVRAQDMDVPRNASAGKKMKRWSFFMMKNMAGLDHLKKSVPEGIKRSVKKWGMIPLPPRPEWDYETRRWALEQVREDAKAILEYCGKPVNY